MTPIWLVLIALAVLAGCSAGYCWGVEDTRAPLG